MGGSVGTFIGKLPGGKSTKHIPKTKLPLNSTNAKGQLRVKDNTGIIRFINLRDGRVMGPAAVPIKPPKEPDNAQS